jgi:hypothetical protein
MSTMRRAADPGSIAGRLMCTPISDWMCDPMQILLCPVALRDIARRA